MSKEREYAAVFDRVFIETGDIEQAKAAYAKAKEEASAKSDETKSDNDLANIIFSGNETQSGGSISDRRPQTNAESAQLASSGAILAKGARDIFNDRVEQVTPQVYTPKNLAEFFTQDFQPTDREQMIAKGTLASVMQASPGAARVWLEKLQPNYDAQMADATKTNDNRLIQAFANQQRFRENNLSNLQRSEEVNVGAKNQAINQLNQLMNTSYNQADMIPTQQTYGKSADSTSTSKAKRDASLLEPRAQFTKWLNNQPGTNGNGKNLTEKSKKDVESLTALYSVLYPEGLSDDQFDEFMNLGTINKGSSIHGWTNWGDNQLDNFSLPLLFKELVTLYPDLKNRFAPGGVPRVIQTKNGKTYSVDEARKLYKLAVEAEALLKSEQGR
jgi:hypothetical protein